MRALSCLALITTLASTALVPAAMADTSISRSEASQLKHDIAGQYRLENGRDVRLTLVDEDLYLDLNRHYRERLLPVGDRLLASRDGRFTVRYMPDGPAERILIHHPGLPRNERIGELRWYAGR